MSIHASPFGVATRDVSVDLFVLTKRKPAAPVQDDLLEAAEPTRPPALPPAKQYDGS